MGGWAIRFVEWSMARMWSITWGLWSWLWGGRWRFLLVHYRVIGYFRISIRLLQDRCRLPYTISCLLENRLCTCISHHLDRLFTTLNGCFAIRPAKISVIKVRKLRRLIYGKVFLADKFTLLWTVVRCWSRSNLLLNDSFLRCTHILNLLLKLLLHLAHLLLHISHLLPLLLASLLEELGLGLDFWELWGLRLPSGVHLLSFTHIISLSHRLLFVCILLAIARVVVLIACLLIVKMGMVVSSSTIVLMRIVHPCHLLLALAHLKLRFLLRLHDKL